jgi:hypothetical protein
VKPFEKPKATVHTERTWLVALAMFAAVAGLPLLTPTIDNREIVFADRAAFFAYFGVVGAILLTWKRFKRVHTGSLQADGAGVAIDGHLVSLRAKLRHAYVHHRDGKILVRLDQRLRDVDVEVESEAEGEALLTAMRLSPSQSVGAFRFLHGPQRREWIVAKTTREWIAELVRASEGTVPFRSPAIPHDALWEIIEDASAPVLARAAAAIVLRDQLSDEGRARLRVTAEACAAPKLRVALETVATDDHADAAQLLESLDEDRRRAEQAR